MKEIAYFPGCTHLHTASHFERSALSVFEALGWRLVEKFNWICCGTVHGLSTDNLMQNVSAVRNLARAESAGARRIVTNCAMCYNTLKQANEMVKRDEDALKNLNEFMDDEPDYRGGVEVLHSLQLLREIGLDEIEKRVVKPLEGLRVAPYYGCLLLRPREVAIDNPERPKIMDEVLKAIGAEIVRDARLKYCCGSYHTVDRKEIVLSRIDEIISAVRRRGADLIAVACPLCEFNLDKRQKFLNKGGLPVLYFTQLIALAFGKEEDCLFEKHHVDPRPLLKERGLLR
jgi:heterodisulfide reductase subunit B